MKVALTAIYITLALSLVSTGLILYNHHSKHALETEETTFELIEPSLEEMTEATEYYDYRQQSQAEPGMLQGAMSCVSCGKNAYSGFKNCPAAFAADGLNPWVDFKCIQAVLKLPGACKGCYCAIAHHYKRRVRGC